MRNKSNIIVLIFISFVLNINAYSNIGRISGYVVDSIEGNPIHYAEITLKDINKVAYSDTNGHFVFDSVPKGNYTLMVEYYRYDDYIIKINTDTLYNDLILKLKKSIDDFSDNHSGEQEQNPYKKLEADVPLLIVNDRSIEYALDTVITFMNKHRGFANRKFTLDFEKNKSNEKLMVISLIYTTYDLYSVPKGVLKYNGNIFYVDGDYQGILKKQKRERVVIVLYEPNLSILDTIDWYFKHSKRGFEIIRINEYGY
ncbi:MAG: carboxypeptidase-like regulatory domain-containing protein [Bacteroidales bacterium]|nr:carboxypeptidase-like regulatory domain-containing protein [Bacteroidales bacterium]